MSDLEAVDSIIAPYRQLLTELQAAGTTGPEMNDMAWAVGEMERQAPHHDEVGSFVADITNDGLFQRFNDAYARLMAAFAEAARPRMVVLPGPNIPSDDELQDRLILRLRSAAERLSRRRDAHHLVGPIQELITMSQRNTAHPVVLQSMAERGLDLVTQGIVHSRAAIAEELEQVSNAGDFTRARMLYGILTAYDEMAAASPFQVPDPLAFELQRRRIEWEHAPAIAAEDAMPSRLRRLVQLVVDWLDAHCPSAVHDPRFLSAAGDEATRRNIEFARDCYPGFVHKREALIMATWGLSFDGAVDQLVARAERRPLPWTVDRLALARETRPVCMPDARPSDDLIAAAEELLARALTPAGEGGAPVE